MLLSDSIHISPLLPKFLRQQQCSTFLLFLLPILLDFQFGLFRSLIGFDVIQVVFLDLEEAYLLHHIMHDICSCIVLRITIELSSSLKWRVSLHVRQFFYLVRKIEHHLFIATFLISYRWTGIFKFCFRRIP